MRVQQWIVVILLSFLPHFALAAITVSVTGASGTGDITGTTGNIFWYSNINAAGDAAASATGGNCSTVRNPNCKNPADVFTVTVASSTAATGGRMFLNYSATAPSGGTLGTPVAASQVYSTNQSITFSPTFSAICTAAGAPLDANCVSATYPVIITLYVIADADNSGSLSASEDTATITLKIKSKIETASSAVASSPVGLYQFLAFPGDQKVHFKNILAVVTFPNIDSGIKNARFYYTTGPNCDMSTAVSQAAFTSITPASTNLETTVDPSTANLGTYFLKGLVNDTTYYFKIALRDYAGNIGYLTPDGESSCSHAAKPSEVVGLLSDKISCFIATAAYGSPFAPQVEILREFRGRFLMNSQWGRSFVRWYYKSSPPWAAAIENRPEARAFVRTALTPVVGFSYLALKFGAKNAAMLCVTLLLLPLLIFRWSRRS
jgi:hypothetical protein